MYASPDETLAALERVGYFTDQKTATTVYLAGRLHRPVMLEGPAGAGKTELATSVSRAYRRPYTAIAVLSGYETKKSHRQPTESSKIYMLLISARRQPHTK